ncbi:MAG: CCA tRNA nucleotidyltransferase [Desulfurococcaceae archaeon]
MATNRFDEVERKILENIKPTPEDRELLLNTYLKIKENIEKYFKSIGLEAEATLQGSVAHDTWLRGDMDIDVFVLFPKHIPVEELKTRIFQYLIDSLKNLGRVELRYAEHPYAKLFIGRVEADIVPAYKLSSPKEITTAVDRTPFHTFFVNSRLNDKLRDDVRLLKKFMKTIGVYGAEIGTRGFSGYAVELLIIAYGGFREVLKASCKWKIPVFIDNLVEEGVDRKELFRYLRKKYPDSIIYLPDPVDPFRNTTANVSLGNVVKMIIASTCYLNNPQPYFFEEDIEIPSREDIIERLKNSCIAILGFTIENLPPECIWGEALRVADRLAKLLERFDYIVIDYSVWTDEKNTVLIAVEVDECTKPTYKLYVGPDTIAINRILDFIKKHVEKNSFGPWIDRDGNLKAFGRRKHTFIMDILEKRENEYMVAPHLKKKWLQSILTPDLLDKLISLDEGLRKWLLKFIVKRERWIRNCIQ